LGRFGGYQHGGEAGEIPTSEPS